MTARIDYQTIDEGGIPRYAVVPIDDFRRLLAAADEADPTIPHAVVSATVDGASPARAWREHLGLSQAELAAHMQISQPAYAQMEADPERLRRRTRERIAEALDITPNQLDF